MYNLTVDEAHTFFVGDGQWLVHNAGCDIDWEYALRNAGDLGDVKLWRAQQLPSVQGKSITQIRNMLEDGGWQFGYWGTMANVEVWVNNIDPSIIRIDKTGNIVKNIPDAVGHTPHLHRQMFDDPRAPSFNDLGILTTDFRGKHIPITNYWFDKYVNEWLHYNRTGDSSLIDPLYHLRFKGQ